MIWTAIGEEFWTWTKYHIFTHLLSISCGKSVRLEQNACIFYNILIESWCFPCFRVLLFPFDFSVVWVRSKGERSSTRMQTRWTRKRYYMWGQRPLHIQYQIQRSKTEVSFCYGLKRKVPICYGTKRKVSFCSVTKRYLSFCSVTKRYLSFCSVTKRYLFFLCMFYFIAVCFYFYDKQVINKTLSC